MDVARLNFSHGNHEEHAETARLVREAAGRVGRPVAILQDLPGPKIRIGPVEGDKVVLRGGDIVTFVTDVSGTEKGTAERADGHLARARRRRSSPASPSTSPTARCACACARCATATASSTATSSWAASSPRARG